MEQLSSSINHHLTSDNIQLLNGIGIFTVIDFLKTESKQIEKVIPLTLKEILEIRKNLLKKYSRSRCAFDYYQNVLKQFAIIPTDIENLDNLLEGGLFSKNIYEICGLPGSGKTILCLTLLKNITSKLDNEIIYIDTKCDFSSLKLREMLSDLNKEQLVKVMNNIKVYRVFSKQGFIKVLLTLKYDIEMGRVVKLVIIDSLPPLTFPSVDQIERNIFLAYTANILQYLSKEYNTIFIVTNLITLWNEGDFKNIDVMKERISCGKYWSTVPNVRIILRKNKNLCELNITKAIKFIPKVNNCMLQINEKGFV